MQPEQIAVPIVVKNGLMRPAFPVPCVVLPPGAREILRRREAANDGKPPQPAPEAA